MLCAIRFLKHFRFAFAFEELRLMFRTGKPDISQLYTFVVEEFVDKFPVFKKLLKKVMSMSND
jgi:hypothetical protein